jgi:hypothetical protein
MGGEESCPPVANGQGGEQIHGLELFLLGCLFAIFLLEPLDPSRRI